VCELLGMSSRVPATVTLSMEELARHGGGTGPHADGWGVAFYEGGDAVVIREPDAAHDSLHLRFLQEHPVRTDVAIAHVRRATVGGRRLANTQPFRRELGGRVHVFAHNGDLARIDRAARGAVHRFRPIGDTDSEWAFLVLLELLEVLWEDAGPPPLEDRLEVVGQFAGWLREYGPANFLYSDGDALFAHGHRRTQPDGIVAAPGMYLLERACEVPAEQDIGGIRLASDGHQQVVLLASVPLTGEPWQPLDEGQVVAARGGQVAGKLSPISFATSRRGVPA